MQTVQPLELFESIGKEYNIPMISIITCKNMGFTEEMFRQWCKDYTSSMAEVNSLHSNE